MNYNQYGISVALERDIPVFRTVTRFSDDNVTIGVFRVFVNDLDLWPPVIQSPVLTQRWEELLWLELVEGGGEQAWLAHGSLSPARRHQRRLGCLPWSLCGTPK